MYQSSSYDIIRHPHASSDDRNSDGSALDIVHRKIIDPTVILSRTSQQSSRVSGNSSNLLDIHAFGGGATGCGAVQIYEVYSWR
ncbi:putative glycerol-3-phosphate dehydrogenase [Helianthus annuus]|nr:putative glycerol-3-phosphate dehydrogenase [Helianthus annuus]